MQHEVEGQLAWCQVECRWCHMSLNPLEASMAIQIPTRDITPNLPSACHLSPMERLRCMLLLTKPSLSILSHIQRPHGLLATAPPLNNLLPTAKCLRNLVRTANRPSQLMVCPDSPLPSRFLSRTIWWGRSLVKAAPKSMRSVTSAAVSSRSMSRKTTATRGWSLSQEPRNATRWHCTCCIQG